MEEDQIKYYEKIEAFVRDQLSDTERAAFLQEMESNPQIQSDVDSFSMADILIERNISTELKGKMSSWKKEETSSVTNESTAPSQKVQKTGVVRSLYKRLAYAASFLLLLAAGSYFMSSNYSDQNLASNYDHTWTANPNVRGETKNQPEGLDVDMAFEAGDMDALLKINSGRSIYYQGLLLKESKQYEAAIDKFESSIKSADSVLKKYAEWQIIIVSLKNGNFDQRAKELLEQAVNDPSNMYNENAKKLNKDLNSFWRKIF